MSKYKNYAILYKLTNIYIKVIYEFLLLNLSDFQFCTNYFFPYINFYFTKVLSRVIFINNDNFVLYTKYYYKPNLKKYFLLLIFQRSFFVIIFLYKFINVYYL